MAAPARPSCSSGSRSWPSTSRSSRSTSAGSRRSSRRSPARCTATASCSTCSRSSRPLLLFLAANTSFNAFPRLLRDPRRRRATCRASSRCRGDRLAFSYGIIIARRSLAAGLIVIFGGSTHLLIPLYAVGVFIDFTISQTGMIRHWLRERSPGYRRRLAINAFGAALTGVVAVIVTAVKFFDGAWLVAGPDPDPCRDHVVHPPPVRALRSVELHVRDEGVLPGPHREQRVIVPVNGINRAVVQAVNFGRSIARDVRAVYVTDDLDVADATARPLGAAAAGHPAGHRRVAVPGGHLAGRSPISTSSTRPGRRTRRPRSRSSCCPSTSLVIGGTGCSTTRRPSG